MAIFVSLWVTVEKIFRFTLFTENFIGRTIRGDIFSYLARSKDERSLFRLEEKSNSAIKRKMAVQSGMGKQVPRTIVHVRKFLPMKSSSHEPMRILSLIFPCFMLMSMIMRGFCFCPDSFRSVYSRATVYPKI